MYLFRCDYACVINITQKPYHKIYLNDALALVFCFYLLCTSVLLLFIRYSFHA